MVRSYHFHIYFDKDTKSIADALRSDFVRASWENLLRDFSFTKSVIVGAMHDEPIGPHTKGQFLLSVKKEAFQLVFNHLLLFRHGLSVLLHAETGDDRLDHTDNAAWLGSPVPLDLSRL